MGARRSRKMQKKDNLTKIVKFSCFGDAKMAFESQVLRVSIKKVAEKWN